MSVRTRHRGGRRTTTIVGIDLADTNQATVVTGHDSRVSAQRRLSCRPWELGELLDWALRPSQSGGLLRDNVFKPDGTPLEDSLAGHLQAARATAMAICPASPWRRPS